MTTVLLSKQTRLPAFLRSYFFRYLLNLIGAPASLTYPMGYGKNGSSISQHENVLHAFSKIEKQTLRNLYKAYQIDFDLFCYKFDLIK